MYNMLPESIEIFGHPFTVVKWTKKQAKKAKLMGECQNIKQEIRLAPDLTDIALCNTLLHEVNHALFWFMTLEECDMIEETIINNLTNGLVATLRQNPELLQFVFIALQNKKPEPEPEQVSHAPVTPRPRIGTPEWFDSLESPIPLAAKPEDNERQI